MKRLVFLFAIAFSMYAGAADGFFVAPIFSGIYGLDGTRYVEQDGQLVEAMPMRGMALPDGAALAVAAIQGSNNYTNIDGVAHNRVIIDFSCNFDWRGWHPYINHVSLNTQRWRLELQDEAVYLGSEKRTSNLSYTYDHHGYIVGYEPTAQVAYYEVGIDSESYDGAPSRAVPSAEYYTVTPSGENAAVRQQYVMIDQHGNITPSNAVATVTEAAATATRLAAAEVAAVAYTNAEAQTAAAVDDLAAAIIGNSLVVYEDDFMYSLGDAIAISTNCLCRIYRFDAKVSQVTTGGVLCDRSWVYFGFTENIGSLNPVAQFKDSLSQELDWDEITCGTPEIQDYSFTSNGDSFEYCYKMSVDIPHTYSTAFLRVYTEITAQVGDGSVLNIVGGIAGGLTGTVVFGNTSLEFIGGLAVEPQGGM